MASPTVYTVEIRHGIDSFDFEVRDVDMETVDNRKSVAWALRRAADLILADPTAENPKVVRIGSGEPVRQGQPDAGMCSAIRDVLDMAEAGDLVNFVGTGFRQDGNRLAVSGGNLMWNVYSMSGSIAWLGRWYEDKVLGLVEEGDKHAG